METVSTNTAIWDMLAERWRRTMRAKALSPNTERGYLYTVSRWSAWLAAEGHDVESAEVKPHHIDDFIADIQLGRWWWRSYGVVRPRRGEDEQHDIQEGNEWARTPLYPDIRTSLPWTGDGHFDVATYTNSHSQLVVRQYPPAGSPYLQIVFEGVLWLETGKSYRQGITLAETDDPGVRPVVTRHPDRLLLVTMTSADGTAGFVAAHILRINRIFADESHGEPLLVIYAHENRQTGRGT